VLFLASSFGKHLWADKAMGLVILRGVGVVVCPQKPSSTSLLMQWSYLG
jgi:hypothetical protein